jgi:hypothetical protein
MMHWINNTAHKVYKTQLLYCICWHGARIVWPNMITNKWLSQPEIHLQVCWLSPSCDHRVTRTFYMTAIHLTKEDLRIMSINSWTQCSKDRVIWKEVVEKVVTLKQWKPDEEEKIECFSWHTTQACKASFIVNKPEKEWRLFHRLPAPDLFSQANPTH